MKRHFEEVEDELKGRLLHMGGVAEEMIHLATQALIERKGEPLARVAQLESEVNALHIEVDDRCLKLIALHQPAAADLRFIMAAVKINSDLERIADQVVNISNAADKILAQPPLERQLFDLPRMAGVAKGMLKDALDAFVKKDVELARSVLQRDDEADQLKKQTTRDLLKQMQADPATIERAYSLIRVARNLERVSDHATNIAEDVIFMVLGKDIRHGAAPIETA